jgi:hypothetical protein
MTIFVINVGNVDYGKYSIPLIQKLCDYNNVNLFILNNDTFLNKYNLHPSWLKLFCHNLIDDDFIITWDLDLIPLKMYDIKNIFDLNKINLSYDTGVLHNLSFFNEKFKYNCGLIGIPKVYKDTLNNIYEINGKNPTYPSYEQYYVNDYIYDNKIDINVLDNKYNFLYNNKIKIDEIYNHHFTWNISHNEKINEIKKIYDEHF